MRKKLRSCIALLGALSMVASFGVQVASAAEADYPDMEVGVFWNSDSDRSDTVYMSYNGADFQQISTAYKADGKAVRMSRGSRTTSTLFMIRVLPIKMVHSGFLAAMCRSSRTWDGVLPR